MAVDGAVLEPNVVEPPVLVAEPGLWTVIVRVVVWTIGGLRAQMGSLGVRAGTRHPHHDAEPRQGERDHEPRCHHHR